MTRGLDIRGDECFLITDQFSCEAMVCLAAMEQSYFACRVGFEFARTEDGHGHIDEPIARRG